MTAPRPPRAAAAPPVPRGTLLFIHGANETSAGLARNVARIQDQVAKRGWEVSVVAPEWRRRSGSSTRGLEAGRLPRRPAADHPDPEPRRRCAQGRRHEDGDVLLRVPARSPVRDDRRADARRRHRLPPASRLDPHRPPGRDRAGCQRRRDNGSGPVLPVALSLGGIALIDLLADWPDAPVEACVTVGSQAPLLYTFDALPALPYDEIDPPRLPVPWLNIYDTRDFLSFVAEPLFRRRDGLASVVDLRVRSGKDFPASHSAYWELPAVWDALGTVFGWRRTAPLTVRQARAQGFEARRATTRPPD